MGLPVVVPRQDLVEAKSRELLVIPLTAGHGLDAEKALAAITTLPARAFDCAGRLGALRRGAEADLVVLDGEPLESTSRVQYVVSGGEVVLEP